MEALSYLRDWYYLHRREVHRYGFVAALFVVSIARGNTTLAMLCCFVAVPVMYAYDRWGEPWRRRGEDLLKRKT